MPVILDFSAVTVLVCEPNEPLRRNIREMLRHLGFGAIACKEDHSECLALLERGPVDLLVCDDQIGVEACFGTVRGIRHQVVDNNPFVVTVSLIDQRQLDKSTVAQAFNSGSDILVAKPFTAYRFTDLVTKIAHERKPFVVTASYVGPTRRQIVRNVREARMEFTVPNPVKDMARGVGRDAVMKRIVAAAGALNRRKLLRNVEEIEIRAGEVCSAVAEGTTAEAIRVPLSRVRVSTRDIQRRMAKGSVEHVPELCRWMVQVVDRIEADHALQDLRGVIALPEIVKGFKMAFGMAK